MFQYFFEFILSHLINIFLRESLLGQLSANLKQTKDEFSRRVSQGNYPKIGQYNSDAVNGILWVKQLEEKVRFGIYKLFINKWVISIGLDEITIFTYKLKYYLKLIICLFISFANTYCI